jgi:hypothetical protein
MIARGLDRAALRAAAAEAREKLPEFRAQLEERQRRRREGRALRQEADDSAAARQLITGAAPPPPPSDPEPDDSAEEAAILAEIERAEAALHAATVAEYPAAVRALERAVAEQRRALAALGEAALARYAAVARAGAATAAAVAALDSLAGDVGHGRVAQRQLAEVRAHARGLETTPPPTEPEVVGSVVAAGVVWLRRGSSPTPGVAERFGPAPGSVLYEGPAVGDPLVLRQRIPLLPAR